MFRAVFVMRNAVALLEAVAAALLVLPPTSAIVRATLGDGAAGRVVALGDVAAGCALRELVSDGGLRERLGGAARVRARLFSDISMAERTAAVYETALDDGHAREAAEAG